MQVWVILETIPEVDPAIVGVFTSEEAAKNVCDGGLRQYVHGPFDLQNGREEFERLDKRIADLEAAIRAITYLDDGAVRNSWHDYIDLGEKAPILRDIHNKQEGCGGEA